jgi:hypothetical protein
MPTGELLVDSFLWREARHKHAIGPGKTRIAKGTKVEVLEDATAVPNNSKVRLIGNAALVGQNGVLADGTEGHITTGKIRLDGTDVLERLKIENPSINGTKPIRAWGAQHEYIESLHAAMDACEAINELADLYIAKETSVRRWRNAARGFYGIQSASGATVLGLAVAAIVTTGGAAAPLLLAFGISSGVAAVSGGAAGASKGTMDRRMRKTTHRIMVAGKDTTVTVAAPFAKQGIVGAASSASAAAGSATAASLGVVAGVAPAVLGAKGISKLNKIDPETVWNWVDWPPIREALVQDRDKLEREKLCAPELARDFDSVIRLLSITLDKIPA